MSSTPEGSKICVDCVRKDCIADPRNPYHQEPHLCFCCSAHWFVTPELLETNLCPECNWLKCPVCGGCRCTLPDNAQFWLKEVRGTFCQSVEKLAKYTPKQLPLLTQKGVSQTKMENLFGGMNLQLMFCSRWARCELQRREENFGLSILGSRVSRPITADELECFPSPGNINVQLVCEEVSTLCPVTGQPDFVTVTISYAPDKLCVETKSLKLYLWSFREKGVFAEALAVEICGALEKILEPYSLEVEVKYQSRGGILLSSTAYYESVPF